jgi:lipopolysaccharide/colanic/teichoic acid biosynthesis glycosyltransferase
MEIRVYKSTSGSVRELLEFICNALNDNAGVAVTAGVVPLLDRCGFLRPVCSGEHAGCYVLTGIRVRSRKISVAECCLASVAILFLVPILLLITVLILLFDGRPILFRQVRYGLDGAEFKILKFRTMIVNSEKLHGLMQCLFGREERPFKMHGDPRVTALGSLLRKSCLDELPQLFNVLRGEMRLCGPRPLPESDSHLYTIAAHHLRLRGKPGITGLWQISDRDRLTFDEMCLLDICYLCLNSLAMDLRIILRTLPATVRR